MKANIIFPEFGLSGGVMVAIRYAQALTSFGWDVMCYAPRMPYKPGKRVKDKLHHIHRLVSNYDVEIALKKCGEFKYEEPLKIGDKTVRDADVVIATAWTTASDVNKLSESKGKKYYFIQDYEVWDDREKGIATYKLPLKHILIAKWIEDILVNEHGCAPGVIVNNGVDLNVFKPDLSKRNESLTISMLYHLLPKKGIADGLEALSAIHRDYPNIKMIMFGKLEFGNKPDFIEYHRDPSQELLVRIYQQSDIFLFPPREEGWGLTVIEAMACGCAIVGTNTGCLLEMGEDGVNALISEPGKPEQLESNLRKLIESKEAYEMLRKNSLKCANDLSWEASYRKFEEALLS